MISEQEWTKLKEKEAYGMYVKQEKKMTELQVQMNIVKDDIRELEKRFERRVSDLEEWVFKKNETKRC